jgi:hypothetical protein
MSIIENIVALPSSVKSAGYTAIKNYVKKHMHGYSSYLKRLLLRMIGKNSKNRPTFDELLGLNIQE